MVGELLKREVVYTGRAFQVRRDRVRLPNGAEADLDIVAHTGAVTLVPIDSDGRVWLVRQYRHAAEEVLLEFPAGTLEPGEDPEACARRECREEIGMAPGRLTPIGSCFLAPGYSTEFMHFYLAQDLTPAPLRPDEDESLAVEGVAAGRLADLVASGALRDAKSLAALYLARGALQAASA